MLRSSMPMRGGPKVAAMAEAARARAKVFMRVSGEGPEMRCRRRPPRLAIGLDTVDPALLRDHVDLSRAVHAERRDRADLADAPGRSRGGLAARIPEAAQEAVAVVTVEVLAVEPGDRV